MITDQMELYAVLAKQREELIQQAHELEDSRLASQRTNSISYGSCLGVVEGRIRREITWCEEQIIALLGGIIHKEFNG